MKTWLFLFHYQILKKPENLSHHTKEFFKLSKKTQRKVLDKYFKKIEKNFPIDTYFNEKESMYYENNQEITFYHSDYFDKKIIEHNITNLKRIDKFTIEDKKIDYLIEYALELINTQNKKINIKDLLLYPEKLPEKLSQNIKFMEYLINQDYTNIKYLTLNEKEPAKQRELIKKAITSASKKEFQQESFQKQDKKIPKILTNNIDFILYLIKNDIQNLSYLTEQRLEYQTITTKEKIIQTIILSLEKNPTKLKEIESYLPIANLLNKEEPFILCIIKLDITNIKYIDWHNLTDKTMERIIHTITNILQKKKINLSIMNYPFHNLFFQNYEFMKYLLDQDFRWIAVTRVTSKEKNNQLIDQFFSKITTTKYHFKLKDFLEDGQYINQSLIENPKMLNYLLDNHVPLVKYIDFFHLENSKIVVENIVNYLEKAKPDYPFHNEDYLINQKYPIPLSNSFRFMRYVIDKNFNHLAYIDTSLINQKDLKRIINYAFKIAYCIKGNQKSLTFDLEGYFQNTDIIQNEYFLTCLKYL